MLNNNVSAVEFKKMNASVWHLAWPAMIEFALQTVVQYADLIMVGGLGNEATAIVGIATQMHFLIKFPISNMSVGVLAYIAKSMGEKNVDKVRNASMQTVFITLFMGIIGTIAAIIISPVLPVFLNIESSLRNGFIEFYCISYSTLLLFTASCMFGGVLRAAGDMKTPMVVNGFINTINIILNAIFIYPPSNIKIGKLAIPTYGLNLGLNGAALATAISIGIGGIIMFIKVYKNETISMKYAKFNLNVSLIQDIIRIGIPAFFCSLVNGFGRIIFTSFVSKLGTTATAAHSIAFTVEGFFYIPAVGFQRAISVFSGNFLGEKNRTKLLLSTRATALMVSTVMLVLGVILFLFANSFTSIFTKDAQVASLSADLLRIVAFSEPIFALSLIMEGVFQGLGNTKTPFWVSTFSMWLFRVCLCFILTQIFHFELAVIWICMVADNICRALLLTWQFSLKKWNYLFE